MTSHLLGPRQLRAALDARAAARGRMAGAYDRTAATIKARASAWLAGGGDEREFRGRARALALESCGPDPGGDVLAALVRLSDRAITEAAIDLQLEK